MGHLPPNCVKRRLFCDQLPRELWRRCKDELLCLKCTKKYSDWRSLRKHMNFFCQMEPLYPCPFCTHRARIPTLLRYHVAREHTAPVSVEEICGDLGYLLDDAADQSGKPIFICPRCGKGYTWKASLQRHLSTGCGLPPMFCCRICEYRTSRKDILFRHMRHVHSQFLA
nr:zinc finger protein 169-like [Nomia melanderi]